MGNIFDILGPVMVGPSSSHTAGAVKVGMVARRCSAVSRRGQKSIYMVLLLQQERGMERTGR